MLVKLGALALLMQGAFCSQIPKAVCTPKRGRILCTLGQDKCLIDSSCGNNLGNSVMRVTGAVLPVSANKTAIPTNADVCCYVRTDRANPDNQPAPGEPTIEVAVCEVDQPVTENYLLTFNYECCCLLGEFARDPSGEFKNLATS